MADLQHHPTEVWAHRGFSARYPENTLSAFTAALAVGVDGIELDVHLSKDGELVVIHDERVDRTTDGEGFVGAYTLAQLKRLDAGSWFDEAFRGAQIPTLYEVLELVATEWPLARLNVELKSDVVRYPGIEEKTWALVKRFGLQERTVFSSFNHFLLRDLKQEHPEADIGLLYVAGLVDAWRYAHYMHAGALHPWFLAIDERVVAEAQANGVAVHAYTVNEAADMRRLLDWQVNAIITDLPDVLIALRDGDCDTSVR